VLYWVAIVLRIIRWRALLAQIQQVALAQVGETLVVGYAVNNLLPARLGEVFRADYAKRRFGITRATVLGSIVIERVLDLCAILSCLLVGLAFVELLNEAGRIPVFEVIALNAALIVGAVIIVIYFLRNDALHMLPLPKALARMLGDLRRGIGALNRRSLLMLVGLSGAVWLFEVFALYWIFLALDVRLEFTQALLIMGAASLSTLVPTAPGYLGTYQLVFVLAMGVFNQPEVVGLVAATTIQIFLFGTVTIAGLALLTRRWLTGSG
jgi:uncharacterized protein (TIRG00374 family)